MASPESEGWGGKIKMYVKHDTENDGRAAEGRSQRRVAPSRGRGLCPLPNLLNFLNLHAVMVAFYANI